MEDVDTAVEGKEEDDPAIRGTEEDDPGREEDDPGISISISIRNLI